MPVCAVPLANLSLASLSSHINEVASAGVPVIEEAGEDYGGRC